MILDQPPAKSRSSTRSFPTNNAHHQVAHNSPKETDNPTRTHRGEAPPINQPVNQPLRLRPPKTKSPPAGHPLYCCQQRQTPRTPPGISTLNQQPPPRALARKYSTKGPISQSTTINQVAYYSVANPVEYPQEKALLLLPPLNKCPPHPHLLITFTPRLSGGGGGGGGEELKN